MDILSALKIILFLGYKMASQLVFYTDNDLKNFTFYKFPKALLSDPHYRDMSDSAKLLYMIFYDRLFLSQKNAYCDDNGILYIHYSLKDIIDTTGWSRDKAKRALKCLEEFNLILLDRKSRGLAYRIYVSKLIVDNLGVGSKRA